MDFAAPLVLAGVVAAGVVTMKMPHTPASKDTAVSARKATSAPIEESANKDMWEELGFTQPSTLSNQKMKMLSPATIKPSVESNLFTRSRGASGINTMIGSFRSPHAGEGPQDA